MKKITIKDIARESGVSIATVSYIINDRKDQKISEATRNKVNQIINLYNFKPNTNAQNLNSNKNKVIAIYCPFDNISSNIENKAFLDKLSFLLAQKKYGLIYLPTSFSQMSSQVDAVIVINCDKPLFYEISNKCLCPVIAVDCHIDDQLFYQINIDFDKLKNIADTKFNNNYTFVYYKFNDQYLNDLIKKTFDNVFFINDIIDFVELFNLNANNYVTINNSIQEFLKRVNKTVLFENSNANAKLDLVLESLENAINRKENLEHKLYF